MSELNNATVAMVRNALNVASDAASVASIAAPVGSICFFPLASAPSGWLKANGALISRTIYADLFAVIGTTFGAGDGSTTFALPDLRGEFLRGWDDGRGVDAGRVIGSAQDATGIDNHLYQTVVLRMDNTDRSYSSGTFNTMNGFAGTLRYVTRHKVRPRNVALLACIKY